MAAKKSSRTIKKRAEFKIDAPKVEVKSSAKRKLEDSGFLKLLSIIFGMLFILIVGAYIYKWAAKSTIKKMPITQTTHTIPQGWKKVEGMKDQVKYEKDTKSGIKPSVVLIQSESNISSPTDYSDKLIAGAQSAIPSLVIENDTTSTYQSYFKRTISGYYYSGNEQVFITQILLINGNRVKTLTASYPTQTEDLEKEINQVFDNLISTL